MDGFQVTFMSGRSRDVWVPIPILSLPSFPLHLSSRIGRVGVPKGHPLRRFPQRVSLFDIFTDQPKIFFTRHISGKERTAAIIEKLANADSISKQIDQLSPLVKLPGKLFKTKG
ncbi:hypothetical protein ADUPG1_004991 [Aduncisulcus paluster]|uniref:Ribosomal protein S10 n=2 Tax=Aduncisulcus paluster TaxID=2918883 RepID=A0ABQ5K7S8_9EUKA|nr:hypothetical protein ADUPG1_004991 [Aduncisulcus paluster]